jgi:hypothetical protein
MASREERERQSEARLLFRRRLMYVVVLLLAVGLGAWFVRWLSRDLGINKIGEHYKQAEKLDEP